MVWVASAVSGDAEASPIFGWCPDYKNKLAWANSQGTRTMRTIMANTFNLLWSEPHPNLCRLHFAGKMRASPDQPLVAGRAFVDAPHSSLCQNSAHHLISMRKLLCCCSRIVGSFQICKRPPCFRRTVLKKQQVWSNNSIFLGSQLQN